MDSRSGDMTLSLGERCSAEVVSNSSISPLGPIQYIQQSTQILRFPVMSVLLPLGLSNTQLYDGPSCWRYPASHARDFAPFPSPQERHTKFDPIMVELLSKIRKHTSQCPNKDQKLPVKYTLDGRRCCHTTQSYNRDPCVVA